MHLNDTPEIVPAHGTAACTSVYWDYNADGTAIRPGLNSAPVQRALFIALDEWATSNIKPPESRVPKLRDGTQSPLQTGIMNSTAHDE